MQFVPGLYPLTKFNVATDLPGAVLISQMWTYTMSAFYPAQLLKRMGWYPKNAIGQYPKITSGEGQGQFYCKRYKKPVFLNQKPEDYHLVEEFDRASEIYDYYVKPFSRPIFEETVRLMQPFLRKNSRILDCSCGPGSELRELAKLVPVGEVVGNDLSADMVATAFEDSRRKEVFNTAFFQSDVAKMPKHFTGRFDVTFSSLAFHHYPNPLQSVKEMYRALTEGGKAIVADPGPKWFNEMSAPLAKWADPGWIGFHTGEEFYSLFMEAGFSEFYWEEILPGIGVCIGTK